MSCHAAEIRARRRIFATLVDVLPPVVRGGPERGTIRSVRVERVLVAAAMLVAVVACEPAPTASSAVEDGDSIHPSATAGSSPAGARDVLDIAWEPAGLDPPDRTAFVGAYAGLGGNVVIGSRYSDAGPNGFTWTSITGGGWAVADVPGHIAPGVGATLGGREILFGRGETDRCAHPAGEAIWSRPVNGIWAPVIPVFPLCAGGSSRLAVGGGAAVIAGTGTGEQPFVWWSDDATTWIDLPQPVDPWVRIRSLGFAADRFWMAGIGEGEAVVIRASDDGRAWLPWTPIVGAAAQEPVGVVPTEAGALIVTAETTSTKEWLIGIDGGIVQADDTLLPAPGLWSVEVVTSPAGSTWIIASIEPRPDRSGPTVLLWSADGATWLTVALPAVDRRVLGLADDGTTVLLVTMEDPTPEGAVGQVWVAASPGGRR